MLLGFVIEDGDGALRAGGEDEGTVAEAGEWVFPKDFPVVSSEAKELAFGMGDDQKFMDYEVRDCAALEVGLPFFSSGSGVDANDTTFNTKVKIFSHSENDGGCFMGRRLQRELWFLCNQVIERVGLLSEVG